MSESLFKSLFPDASNGIFKMFHPDNSETRITYLKGISDKITKKAKEETVVYQKQTLNASGNVLSKEFYLSTRSNIQLVCYKRNDKEWIIQCIGGTVFEAAIRWRLLASFFASTISELNDFRLLVTTGEIEIKIS